MATPKSVHELTIRVPHNLPPLIMPGSYGKLQNLITLDLRESLITRLPGWIDQLVMLSRLVLKDCAALERLPDALLHLDAPWVEIDLTGCSSIEPAVIDGANEVMQHLVEREKQRIRANQFKIHVTNASGKQVLFPGNRALLGGGGA